MQTTLQDLRSAVRAAWGEKTVSLVAVLTLALGIGANTALFTVAHAVLLAPLPFRDADRLVRITGDFTGQNVADIGLSIPELFDFRDRAQIFDSLAGVWPISANLTETDEPERIETALVDANYFTMLGVTAQVGRVFGPADATKGIGEGAVISDAIWRRRFGADPSVIGRRIRIDNDMYSIIGVAPPHFRHPGRSTEAEVAVWASCGWLASPFSPEPSRRAYLLQGGLGRLRPGLSLAAAQAKLDVLAADLRREYAGDYPSGAAWTPRLIPLRDDLVGHVRPAILTLLAAVALVLLIACANVANLLLARSSVRQREIAIRRALGASRARLVRQMLTESVVLAAVGGLLGLLVALWSVEVLVRLSPASLPPLEGVSINVAVLGFTTLLSLITGVLFGLAPAVQGSSSDLQQVIRESAHSTTVARRTAGLRAAFVVSQFALALVLLVGAALLVQSFWRLQRLELGFHPSGVLTARMWLPQPNDPRTGPYFTHAARTAFYQRVLERVAALPGVTSVAGVVNLPLSGARAITSLTIEGRPIDETDTAAAQLAIVTPGYLDALGITLTRGRFFSEFDNQRAPGAVVVSESFARKFFPGEDAIGKRVISGRRVPVSAQASANWLTIIGVVRDVKTDRLETDLAPIIYRPLWQISNLNLTLLVRTAGEPLALADAVAREVRAVDPNQPVYGVRTMEAIVSVALADRRFTMQLLALFAATALLLSGIGIYGVMAYFVSQRTREIGVRMALGASERVVMRMVLGRAGRLIAVGVVVGVVAALVATRAISTLLFGIGARDPLTYLGLSAMLAATALVATYLPGSSRDKSRSNGRAAFRLIPPACSQELQKRGLSPFLQFLPGCSSFGSFCRSVTPRGLSRPGPRARIARRRAGRPALPRPRRSRRRRRRLAGRSGSSRRATR